MSFLRESLVRLYGSLARKRTEQDLDDELQFHIDKLTEKHIKEGMTPDDARRSALIEFGGRAQIKDDARDELLSRPFEDVGQDLRFALRMLRKSPAFAIVAVLSLALGIGANTAVFSVVNAIVLQPLPYPDPGRLMAIRIKDADRSRPSSASVADYRGLSASPKSFTAVGAYAEAFGGITLTGRGEAEKVTATSLTSGIFQALGVPASVGRTPTAEDDREGAGRVVVLSHRFWRDRFGSSPSAVGETLTLDGDMYTIIGVMPPGFTLPNHPNDQFWPGLQLSAPQARAPFYLWVYGRLAPGVTEAQATAELASIATSVKQQYPASPTGWKYVADDLKTSLVGDRRSTVLILYAAVALILLMASANVANLTLARAATRLPELSLRLALGAGRRRLIRQLLTESLLIASLGGVLGIAIAYAGTGFLVAAMPGGMPYLREIRIDTWVLVFTAGIALLSGIAIGLVPAFYLPTDRVAAELREGTRRGSHGTRHRRFASALVISEFALALTVLISAGLVVNSLLRLQRVDVGVKKEGLLVVRVAIPNTRYPDDARVDAFYDNVMQRVRELPGVSSVAVSMAVPPSRLVMTNPYTPQGKVIPPGEGAPVAEELSVSSDYFKTFGIQVLRGRSFSDTDRQGATDVAIVNETFARENFPGEDALGKWIQTGDPSPDTPKMTIVGVVPDVKYQGMNAAPEPTIYVPFKQNLWWRSMYLTIRTAGNPLARVEEVRAAVSSVDPLVALRDPRTMEALFSESVAEPRYLALLLGSFGVLGLILAGAGIYGVLSYNVNERMRETGIRLALGATTTGVQGLVIRDGMRLAVIGVVLGVAIAFATTRLLRSILFEVSPIDPLTFGATALFLMFVGFLACAIPARRASRTDPMVAIRGV